MPNKRKLNKKKQKKGKRRESSGSSTPQSSTPSVEDDKQQLLQGGACGYSGSHESRSVNKTKGVGPSASPEEELLRSTGATSSSITLFTPSVEDDTEQLLPGGTYGYGDSRASRSVEKTKYGPRSSSGKGLLRLSAGGIFSKKDPHSVRASGVKRLAVSDPGNPRSPSKSPFRRILKRMSPGKKSPGRSSDPKCRNKDEKSHDLECPEFNLAACAKDESLEGNLKKLSLTESKHSSSSASPITSRKQDGAQSSSSSVPSVSEYSRNASANEHSGKLSLGVPVTRSSSSSPSKSLTEKAKGFLKSMGRSSNRSSDTDCSWENQSDRNLECPERIKNEKGAKNKSSKSKSSNCGQIKSETSSSSGSPSISKKNNRSDTSYVSLEISRRSNSKSSSSSDPNAAKSGSNKASRASKGSSDKIFNKSKSELTSFRNPGYDPQEESSRGPARQEQSRGEELLDKEWRRFVEDLRGEPIDEGIIPVVEHLDEGIVPVIEEEPKEQSQSPMVPRRRSKSKAYQLRIRLGTSPSSSPRDSRELDRERTMFQEQSQELANRSPGQIDWPWLERISRPNRPRDPRENNPDENERLYLRHVVENMPSPSVRRYASASPEPVRRCNCGRGPYYCVIGCSRRAWAARRISKKPCRKHFAG